MDQDSEPYIGEPILPEPELETTPVPRRWAGMMGRRRRRMGMAFTLMALGTFAMPLIGTTPNVLGQSHLSPLQVVAAMISGTLPLQPVIAPQVNFAIDVLLGPGIVYPLLIAIAVALLVFPSEKFVGAVASLGLAAIVGSFWWQYPELQEAIFGAPRAFASGHVNGGVYSLTLGGLLVMLLLITISKDEEWE